MRRIVWTVVGLAVSALALLLAFARVHVDGGLRIVPRFSIASLRYAIAAARPGWLAAYLALNLTSLAARALQLRALCRRRDGTPPSLAATYHAVAIGMLAQNLLPARLGEAARIVALAKADDVAPSEATGAVVLGRVLDLVALLLATCVPALVLGFDAGLPRLGTIAAVGTGVALALTLALFALYRFRAAVTRAATQLSARFGRAIGGFLDGLSALGSPRRLLAATLPSLAAPLLVAASYACALHAFALGWLPAGSSLVLVAVVFLAVAVPSAPSSVGVYHAAVTWLLPALGAPPPTAAAFAIVTHALGTTSFLILGLISFLRVGITLRPAPQANPRP